MSEHDEPKPPRVWETEAWRQEQRREYARLFWRSAAAGTVAGLLLGGLIALILTLLP